MRHEVIGEVSPLTRWAASGAASETAQEPAIHQGGKMLSKKLVVAITLVCCLAWIGMAWAAGNTKADRLTRSAVVPAIRSVKRAETDSITVPRLLNYQGKLLDSSGGPVVDTMYPIEFRLYAQASGGTSIWNETQTVRTRTGLFSVALGSVTPINGIPRGGELYLGMKVGTDAEMSPRARIASAAYAYLAEYADTASYADTANYARTAGTASSVNKVVRGCIHFVRGEYYITVTLPQSVDSSRSLVYISPFTLDCQVSSYDWPSSCVAGLSANSITISRVPDGSVYSGYVSYQIVEYR
jgi:hypothetical protein